MLTYCAAIPLKQRNSYLDLWSQNGRTDERRGGRSWCKLRPVRRTKLIRCLVWVVRTTSDITLDHYGPCP